MSLHEKDNFCNAFTGERGGGGGVAHLQAVANISKNFAVSSAIIIRYMSVGSLRAHFSLFLTGTFRGNG